MYIEGNSKRRKIMNISNEKFGLLYEKYYKEVYYVALKLVGDVQSAQDITQDAFLKAYSHISTLDNIDNFLPYVKKIARNEGINFLRRKNLIKFESAVDENLEDIQAPQKSPEDQTMDKDVQDILLKLINSLPTEQRITLVLFYYEDMSVKEIAKLCNCSEKTIYSRLSYAKKNLRMEVEKIEDSGVKLRCIAALPFIYLVFMLNAKDTFATTKIPQNKNFYSIEKGACIMKTKLLKIITGSIFAVCAIIITIIIAINSNKKTVRNNSPINNTTNASTTVENMNQPEYDYDSKIIFKYDDKGNIIQRLVVVENKSDYDLFIDIESDFTEKSSLQVPANDTTATLANYKNIIAQSDNIKIGVKSAYTPNENKFKILNSNCFQDIVTETKNKKYGVIEKKVINTEEICSGSGTIYVVLYDEKNNVVAIDTKNYYDLGMINGVTLYRVFNMKNCDHYEIYNQYFTKKANSAKYTESVDAEVISFEQNDLYINAPIKLKNELSGPVEVCYEIAYYDEDDNIVNAYSDSYNFDKAGETIIKEKRPPFAEKISKIEIYRVFGIKRDE